MRNHVVRTANSTVRRHRSSVAAGVGRRPGGGSLAYDGPRDVAHRAERPRLTARRLRAINAAWNGGGIR